MSIIYESKNSSKSATSASILTNAISGLSVSNQPLDALILRENNPRTHSRKQISQLAKMIREYDHISPILVDENNTIIAGHARVEAARLLKIAEVPTISVNGWSKEKIIAYIIADNRSAELAGWDEDLLALHFQELIEFDSDFDLTITGFENPEIDLIIESVNHELDPTDDIPPLLTGIEPVSQHGDLWLLAEERHRVCCGDATDPSSYAQLLGNELAQQIFTDPPYNVPISGHVSGLGKTKHSEFVMASGELSSDQFTEFLSRVIRNMIRYSDEGSLHFICMDWRHLSELQTAAQLYDELKNLCVWVKENGGMGSLYRSQHELVLVYKNGTEAHTNNVQLGKYGRYRTNVWEYPGANSFHASREDDLAMHPTVKPLEMVKDAILDCSNRDDVILDPFGGSGTTLIAAEHSGRRGYIMELDPCYVDLILQRYQALTGIEPVHAQSGLSFSDIANERKACTGNSSAKATTSLCDENEIAEMEGCSDE